MPRRSAGSLWNRWLLSGAVKIMIIFTSIRVFPLHCFYLSSFTISLELV